LIGKGKFHGKIKYQNTRQTDKAGNVKQRVETNGPEKGRFRRGGIKGENA
jgi:hypothetical protein